MKKTIYLILCAAMLICASACDLMFSSDDMDLSKNNEFDFDLQDDDSQEESSSTESECQHVLTEQVYKEASYGVNGIKIVSCTLCDFYELGEIPALPSVFELNVKGKKNVVQDTFEIESGKECWTLFDIDIENISDKTIKKISGSLTVFCGGSILKLEITFDDLSIKANATQSFSSYGYSFDYASLPTSVERQVYDAEFEDLTFVFEPSEVVAE